MSKNLTSTAIGSEFKIEDYVNAANDAASRTRTVTIIMVIATVLIGIGFWNSVNFSWATERVKAAYDKNYQYKYKILFSPEHKSEDADTLKYQENLQQHVVRAYIDNVRFVRIPFFGIAFDVNDLAPIGGLSLIIILLMMRFSLSREIKNLNVSFREAVQHNQLCHFYHALAMRQVFTVPQMKGEKQNWWLSKASRLVFILPVFVFGLGVGYDWWSILNYGLFTFDVASLTLFIGTTWLASIAFLSWKCWERQSHINQIWDDNWNKINNEKFSTVKLDEDLVSEFGSDEAVNKALRHLRKLSRQETGEK
jgi:hypothetical protein